MVTNTKKQPIEHERVRAARIAFQTALQTAYYTLRTEVSTVSPGEQEAHLLSVQEVGRFTGEIIYDVIKETPSGCFPSVWKDMNDLKQNMCDLASENTSLVIDALLAAEVGKKIEGFTLIPITVNGKDDSRH